jgi:hypothetical protein
MNSGKYGANKKKKLRGREGKKITEREKKNVFLDYKGFDVISLAKRAREEKK